MFNLHCHSLLSDGYLLPSEVAMRYRAAGYKAIAITDHADYSNIRIVIPAIVEFCRNWPRSSGIIVLPGVELTHLPPQQFSRLVRIARREGARVVIGHGETPVEPVAEGTNRAALEAGVDILAHPGRITDDEVLLAREKGIFLEITSRRGHRDGNAHVAARAAEHGAPLIFNQDSHSPDDIIPVNDWLSTAKEAGLDKEHIDQAVMAIKRFISRKTI